MLRGDKIRLSNDYCIFTSMPFPFYPIAVFGFLQFAMGITSGTCLGIEQLKKLAQAFNLGDKDDLVDKSRLPQMGQYFDGFIRR